MRSFSSDNQRMGEIWETEKAKDNENRLNELEKKVEQCHNKLVFDLRAWSSQLISMLPPPQGAEYTPVQLQIPQSYAGVINSQGSVANSGGSRQWPQLPVPGAPNLARFRDRVGSANKRQRVDDTANHKQQNQSSRVPNDANKAKVVVGTAASQDANRKMRVPPADIFVWGMHPDTTDEDIVNDLAACNILIEAKDIEKKSKDEAPRNSYRISVPAPDLQRALDPGIWPLRVKVREYIYYPKKKASKPQATSQPIYPANPFPMLQFGNMQLQNQPSIPVSNRYDSLRINDNGEKRL